MAVQTAPGGIPLTTDALTVKVSNVYAGPGDDTTYNAKRTLNQGDDAQWVTTTGADVTLGATGAVGDYLKGLTLVGTGAGTLLIKDNATTKFSYTFAAGLFVLPEGVLGMTSVNGAWKVNISANGAALCTGVFT